MTFKRSLALAALLALGLSATTGFARRNPEEQLTHQAMLSKTGWAAAKLVLFQQFLTKVAPHAQAQLEAYDSTADHQATQTFMGAAAAGLFINQFKDYFEEVREYLWDNVGQPVANQLPEPVRTFVCDN